MNQRKYSVIGPHDLVGIEPRIKEFESLLSFEISDVEFLGWVGLEKLFLIYRSKFECCFFSENMRDMKYTLSHSHVLKQFLSQVSAEECGTADDWPSLCKSKLRIKRILIVLDDVSDLSELESFYGGDDLLCGQGIKQYHLYAALKRKSISTYVDELSLGRGDQIISAVHQAIEKSMVSVVIFSKYYASSTWCLDEPVKLMECNEKMGQIVMPVFYHVAPSDVRKQKGSFEEAFDVHEQRFKGDRTKVLRWRNALTQASNLCG